MGERELWQTITMTAVITSLNFDNFSHVNKSNFGKWQESTTQFTFRPLDSWAGENIYSCLSKWSGSVTVSVGGTNVV